MFGIGNKWVFLLVYSTLKDRNGAYEKIILGFFYFCFGSSGVEANEFGDLKKIDLGLRIRRVNKLPVESIFFLFL